ncbi:hypothetical protein DSO57_1019631 [Entomophthora muscae]|uniref:Uncharacterized protein n=2 Tax=Entomophthora muscae TaxID=34485 RepID=A0ACC2SSS5_9FUNG|nr:hypothetical protein DSO57_1019693 [Entomophthora muscae]KAJ9065454.1 hypothetical protein DSO57_1019631 [Entomophthora muscae]
MSKQNPRLLDTLEYYEKIFLKYYKELDGFDPLPKVKEATSDNAMLEGLYQTIVKQLYIVSRIASLSARGAFIIVLVSNIPVILGSLMCDIDSSIRQIFEALLYFNFAIPYAIANGCLRIENYLSKNHPNFENYLSKNHSN